MKNHRPLDVNAESRTEAAIQRPLFFAHSLQGQGEEHWQTLPDHSKAVGKEAGESAREFGAEGLAEVIGLLHDLGKYTVPFQDRLRGNPMRVDHSTWGARIAQQRFGPMGQLLAYGIAGHHAGLANGQGEGERTALIDRLAAELPALHPVWEEDTPLPTQLGTPKDFKLYSQDRQQARDRQPFQLAFLTRMLFSCLVDADFLDTERFYNAAEKRPDHRNAGNTPPTLTALREQLNQYLGRFSADSDVNRLRADIVAA